MSSFEIAHMGISVSQLDRAVKWYGDYFGFKEVKRFERTEFAVKGALLQLGTGFLELLAPKSPAPNFNIGKPLYIMLQKVGANHMALQVDDIQACYDDFKKCNSVGMVTGLVDGRLFFCTDPDGTVIEVKQKG